MLIVDNIETVIFLMYNFYTHGCNVFIHARTFGTIAHITSIPVGAMYLHARTFFTLADNQYGFFFLGLNVHFDTFARRNCPSVTVGRIFEFVHCPINLCSVLNKCNLNGISCVPCEKGVSTYSL